MINEIQGNRGDTRRDRERHGRRAETRAAIALRLKGYRVLDRRVRTSAGEVDLVVRRGCVVASVEVKAKKDARARCRVSPTQRRPIVRAAADYIAAFPRLAVLTQRFDAVLVEPRR
jgi:putative endonuclease